MVLSRKPANPDFAAELDAKLRDIMFPKKEERTAPSVTAEGEIVE